MKTKLLLISLLSAFSLTVARAQVGIGTLTPDASAILHLSNPNKGLLLTSIALTSVNDASTIPSPATGLLIWNNGLGGLAAKGLYYWDNSKWNSLSSANSSANVNAWNTSGGNSGSGSGASTTISMGTSSYDDLVLLVNNNSAARFGANNSVSIGIQSAAANGGVAMGHNAQSTSNQSAAFGVNSIAAGYQSVALGYNAKTNSNSETALGYNTLTNGQNSTALGSGAAATGQFSTALGYGSSTNQANAIILGNSFANVGIGTDTPNNSVKIDVNGQYKLGTNGSVHKNQISFEVWPNVSITGLQSGRTDQITINIPAGFQPGSTKASIVVSPANDFAGNTNFGLSNPRMNSVSSLTVNVTNISNGNANLYSGHFYVTISEF
ncbi:hypothetical protein PGH12_02740 [Chryseobacterium wangxinyae]|uniref:hypothetical protein n=1 Tax=Chryseobacterium sp. CY350 TaxID=2997336 RepID=UPI00226E6B29|nr:hypothetical protein [Chryseobacterium sp. CY350]MCY0978295.1 hypothetical protein [Chryseobacterium sp. CY350]WBZ96073.1 hypothetical protein PGH12_02740 [Chryseobacterium sp. CY350]